MRPCTEVTMTLSHQNVFMRLLSGLILYYRVRHLTRDGSQTLVCDPCEDPLEISFLDRSYTLAQW